MTALYRAYRPQTFDDVVGQQSAVRTLRNAITQDRVAHAYLFTGSKGTGKTTMAKLLAKALNCEQGPTIDPCGVCESCVAIAEGRSMDVAEIDAASNRGIDDVREKIIDTVAYQPTSGTRRVYILDEAHQLTSQAFNALLKTIEEPPAHVLFIFCTTETHQMMPTVRDRCQRLALAPPSAEDLLGVLRRTADQEKIVADDQALRAIARVAQGSFRNALGLLEMLATAFDRSFTHADVLHHLGAFSEDLLFAAADAVLGADVGTVLRTVEELTQVGSDIEQFSRELAEHLRVLLLARNGVETVSIGVTDMARLADQAGRADERRILAAIDCINDALARIRVGSDPRLSVEAALARACQGLGLPSLALRLAALEHGEQGSYGLPLASPASGTAELASPASNTVERAATPVAVPASIVAPTTATATIDPAANAQPAAPTGTPGTPGTPGTLGSPGDVADWWPRALAAMPASQRPMLAQATPLGIENERLIIQSPIPLTDKVRTALGDQVERQVGRRLGLEVREAGPITEMAPSAAAASGATNDASGPDDDIDWQEASAASDTPVVATVAADDGPSDVLSRFQGAFDATELSNN